MFTKPESLAVNKNDEVRLRLRAPLSFASLILVAELLFFMSSTRRVCWGCELS